MVEVATNDHPAEEDTLSNCSNLSESLFDGAEDEENQPPNFVPETPAAVLKVSPMYVSPAVVGIVKSKLNAIYRTNVKKENAFQT